MSNHTFKEWFLATRPWSFPASAMPVAVTMAYCFYLTSSGDSAPVGPSQWAYSIVALISMILFQAVGNVWSDLRDFKRGVDTADSYGVKILTSGQFSTTEVRNLAIALFCITSSLGVLLAVCCGPVILALGIAGIALTVFYPFLKYNALGDVDIFLTYALLPTAGTSYLITGTFVPEAIAISVPVGLITVAILHANNTRDVATDRRAGIRTLAMIIGNRASRTVYVAEVVLPLAITDALILSGILPAVAAVACAAALLPTVRNIRMIAHATPDNLISIGNLDEHTAKLQLVFSLSLSAALTLYAILLSHTS